uniref:Uncharacterized protein n=1 Tax=Anopheles atroparvus TaxID=41427 RepID=A0A182JDG8_ANOAO
MSRVVGQQSPSEPSARMQNSDISTSVGSCGTIPCTSRSSAEGNQAGSVSSMTWMPHNLREEKRRKRASQRITRIAATLRGELQEGCDQNRDHGDRGDVLPAQHPVQARPGAGHQLDIIRESTAVGKEQISNVIISFGTFGNSFMSISEVLTPSSVPNCESMPSVNSIRKNSTAHTCAAGNWLMASVKMMKASPVPEALWREKGEKACHRRHLATFGHTGNERCKAAKELNAIRPPKASPREKKICVPASSHTTGSRMDSQRGVNRCAMPSNAPAKGKRRKDNATFECDAAEEEDDEHHVREDGGDIDDLAGLGDALDHAEVHQRPGGNERHRDGVVDPFRLVHARRNLQRLAVPVPLRALGPRQRRLEAVQQVDQAPGDDGVVVERHDVADERGRDADAAEVAGHLVPHPDRALAQPLPDGQLQVEDGQALEQQHDEVRHQERTAAVLLREVRETPHVAEPDGVAAKRKRSEERWLAHGTARAHEAVTSLPDGGQQECPLAVPALALILRPLDDGCGLLLLLLLLLRHDRRLHGQLARPGGAGRGRSQIQYSAHRRIVVADECLTTIVRACNPGKRAGNGGGVVLLAAGHSAGSYTI